MSYIHVAQTLRHKDPQEKKTHGLTMDISCKLAAYCLSESMFNCGYSALVHGEAPPKMTDIAFDDILVFIPWNDRKDLSTK